jgi:hypothetical protein
VNTHPGYITRCVTNNNVTVCTAHPQLWTEIGFGIIALIVIVAIGYLIWDGVTK